MSRYNLPPKADNREVTVGWDATFDSFFLSVTETDFQDYEKQLVLVGCFPDEQIDSVEDLVKRTAPYADIDPQVQQQLREDQQVKQSPIADLGKLAQRIGQLALTTHI